MPRFTDRIATMPRDELLKEIQSIEQERNELYDHSRVVFNEWRDAKIADGEMRFKSIHRKIKQTYSKLKKASDERIRRDLQEARG